MEVVRDELHFLNVVRYIDMNPVAAGICGRPEDCRGAASERTSGSSPGPAFLANAEFFKYFGMTRQQSDRAVSETDRRLATADSGRPRTIVSRTVAGLNQPAGRDTQNQCMAPGLPTAPGSRRSRACLRKRAAMPPSDDLRRLAQDHLWLHFTRMGGYEPPIIVRGEGCYLEDTGQPLPRRARRAVRGADRLLLRRRDRPRGARADARAAVLHQLVLRAPARDRARRRGRGRSRRAT